VYAVVVVYALAAHICAHDVELCLVAVWVQCCGVYAVAVVYTLAAHICAHDAELCLVAVWAHCCGVYVVPSVGAARMVALVAELFTTVMCPHYSAAHMFAPVAALFATIVCPQYSAAHTAPRVVALLVAVVCPHDSPRCSAAYMVAVVTELFAARGAGIARVMGGPVVCVCALLGAAHWAAHIVERLLVVVPHAGRKRFDGGQGWWWEGVGRGRNRGETCGATHPPTRTCTFLWACHPCGLMLW
jgi:hypothetical protein